LDWETAYAQDYRIDALYHNETVATLFDYAHVNMEHNQSRRVIVTSRSKTSNVFGHYPSSFIIIFTSTQ
jgi:hypothetical protein